MTSGSPPPAAGRSGVLSWSSHPRGPPAAEGIGRQGRRGAARRPPCTCHGRDALRLGRRAGEALAGACVEASCPRPATVPPSHCSARPATVTRLGQSCIAATHPACGPPPSLREAPRPRAPSTSGPAAAAVGASGGSTVTLPSIAGSMQSTTMPDICSFWAPGTKRGPRRWTNRAQRLPPLYAAYSVQTWPHEGCRTSTTAATGPIIQTLLGTAVRLPSVALRPFRIFCPPVLKLPPIHQAHGKRIPSQNRPHHNSTKYVLSMGSKKRRALSTSKPLTKSE